MSCITDIQELDPNKNYFIRFPHGMDEEARDIADRLERFWEEQRRLSGWKGVIIFVPDTLSIEEISQDI